MNEAAATLAAMEIISQLTIEEKKDLKLDMQALDNFVQNNDGLKLAVTIMGVTLWAGIKDEIAFKPAST